MGNVVLLTPDGIGVRNFVLGQFLRQASKEGQVVHTLHIIPNNLLPNYSSTLNGQVQWHSLISYKDKPLSFILRRSLSYAQMYWVDSRPMRYMRSQPVVGSWRTQTAAYAARLIGRASAAPRRMQMLDSWHCSVVSRLPEVAHYRQLFERISPSVLFCSHQRPIEILPPVLAARSLGIPTATFIFSWDNLTSKGRIAAPFDHYLVWSDHMRQELLSYYPDVSIDRIHVVGTPQFEPYADESLIWPRDEFFRRIGGDPSRPLLCYSGGDAGGCPEDPEHLQVLMDLIRAGRIRGNPQVLLRPMPVDDGSRYDKVRSNYPELIYARPSWVHTEPGNWARVIPLPEDIQFLANLTHYSDLNINLASTMTLDFAMHDKPVVNVAFNVASPPPFGASAWEFNYQFEHYRPVVELGAARFARSPEEFATHINAYLEDPSLDRDNRRRLVELEVGVPLGQSSQRIVEVLGTIAR